jgi:hypothetical protein
MAKNLSLADNETCDMGIDRLVSNWDKSGGTLV